MAWVDDGVAPGPVCDATTVGVAVASSDGAEDGARVTDGATVHRCSGSDFNVILNDNAANLRHFEMSVAAHHKAKSILPYIASRMHNDPVANQSVTDHRIGAD